MSMSISQQEQSLREQLAQGSEKIVALEKKMRVLDDDLAGHLGQREQYQLLDELCAPLEKINRAGASDLFRETTGYDSEKQLQQLRATVSQFQQSIAGIEKLRSVVQADIQAERVTLNNLNHQLAELQAQEEHLKHEKEMELHSPIFIHRPTAMPWSIQGEDERRFRRILVAVLSLVTVFGGLIPILKQPVEETMGIVVPERIAQLVKKKKQAKLEAPKPVEKPADIKDSSEGAKPPEKTAEASVDRPKPAPAEVNRARKRAESRGVLAFKSNFADLMKDTSPSKAGTAARISVNAQGEASTAPKQQAVIMSQAIIGSSGGINTTTINRQSDIGGAQRIVAAEVKIARVESAVIAGAKGVDRPLSKGGSASRTDEEIQIIFDQYKSALYRIYNRELRNNPSLRGKMVLRIVIEADGRVSSCTINSSDLASPALSADIVDRVLKFNFGPKEGVPAITILYPIDFMPAN